MSKTVLVQTAGITAMKARTEDVPRIAAAAEAGNILSGAVTPPDAPTTLTFEEFKQAKTDFRAAKQSFHSLDVQCKAARREMERLKALIASVNEKMIDQLVGSPRSNALANAGPPANPGPPGGAP